MHPTVAAWMIDIDERRIARNAAHLAALREARDAAGHPSFMSSRLESLRRRFGADRNEVCSDPCAA